MTVTDEVKRVSLIAFTGLVVAFVRSKVLSNTWFWPSTSDFLSEWFFCSAIVLLVLVISYATIRSYERMFFTQDSIKHTGISVETNQVYGSFIMIIASVATLVSSMIPR